MYMYSNFLIYIQQALSFEKENNSNDIFKPEKWYINLIQIVIPFIIAGFGMVGAGILLNEVKV